MQSVVQSTIWTSTIPLHVTHASSDLPFLVHLPRLSYLPLLLPRLNNFFNAPCTAFTYEGILLKNLPVGLLVDLYAPGKEQEKEWDGIWRIEVGEGVGWDMEDTFMNSVKEADFIRNGTAKGIMSMSKEDSTTLWNAVQDNDFKIFNLVNSKLLNPLTPLKHIPLRIYVPTQPTPESVGSFKVVQTLVTPRKANREIQTLGTALNQVLPDLFPSRRDPILAEAVLHGAPLPFRAPLEEVMREAAYADGWIHICVVMLN